MDGAAPPERPERPYGPTGAAPGGPGAPPPGPPGEGGPPWGPDRGGWSPSQWSQPQRASDGVAIAALVTGILGLLASLIPLVGLFIGLPLAVAAIVCGVIGLRRGIQRGLAIGGLVTGALAVLVSIGYILLFAFFWSERGVVLDDIMTGEGLQQDGPVAAESPCADSGETVQFDTPLESEQVSVHQVEACPDFVEDVQFGVEVENTASRATTVSLEVTARAGDDVVSTSSAGDVVLQPGQRGWVEIVTFDDWRAPDAVDVNVEQS